MKALVSICERAVFPRMLGTNIASPAVRVKRVGRRLVRTPATRAARRALLGRPSDPGETEVRLVFHTTLRSLEPRARGICEELIQAKRDSMAELPS